MKKKYILAFGFRRLAACKKLGHKSILALIHPSKQVKEVEIDEIDVKDNTRLNDDTSGFEDLMQSIKDNGLLQPVGVWNIEDLTEEDYLTINIIENIHRKDISPFELSKAVRALMAVGLNIGQIAVRISQPKSRIISVMTLTKERDIIDEFKSSSFIGENKRNKLGKLPFAVINAIASARTTKANKKSLIDFAKERELSVRETRIIMELLSSGLTFAKAKQLFNKLDLVTTTITYNVEKFAPYKEKYNKSIGKVIKDMLYGRIPLDTSIFE